MGYQFSKWRMGPHALAFSVLATSRGYQLAQEAGISGDPQKSHQCLQCHTTGAQYDGASFQNSFDFRDGVQCEACHGPGSEYSPEAVMLDKAAAGLAGLREVNEKTCLTCHEADKAHGKPFHFQEAAAHISHPTKLSKLAERDHYKTPLNLALTPDQKELWIACEASHSLAIVDVVRRVKVAEIPIGGQPHDVTFDPAGRRAFVSNRLDDTVSVVDVKERKVLTVLEVGDEPHGLLFDKEGKYLYVLNTSIDSISVFDAVTLREIKRLTASRSPWSLDLSPDGRRIFVSNTLSRFVPERTPSMSEVTVIDTETVTVVDRVAIPAANLLQGVAWHPSGEYAVITLNRTKNLVPMTRLLQGWTISNGLGIVWRDGSVDQVILDQPHLSFPDPADVIVTPDGRYALATSSGSDRVAVVDLSKLISMLQSATPYERSRVFPNHLGKSTEFVATFLPTQDSPRGVTCSADGSTAYVANALDDSVTVIDLKKLQAVTHIDLGGPTEITLARQGEKLFHDARITFRRQFSCHTCHPDGHIDGITYDIEPDGLGISPVDNRTLRGINDMAPYKWEGTNPSLRRQCGPRLAVFFTRIQPFTPDELTALDTYICTIPRPPNRYRKLGAPLTPAQRRGKALFDRTHTNDGRLIPVGNRCVTCHPPPLYTDGFVHDVGTKTSLDREALFDSPHLLNIYDSAPYLHNGMAVTLEEIWTRYNPYDEHGITNDMTKDQLNDLIEYLRTL
jgi:YVTN family beta-propeller protein